MLKPEKKLRSKDYLKAAHDLNQYVKIVLSASWSLRPVCTHAQVARFENKLCIRVTIATNDSQT